MKIDDLYPSRKNYYRNHMAELEANKEITEKNKEDLKAFSLSLLSTGRTKDYRVGKLLSQLKPMSLWLGKDFRTATLEDLQGLIAKINSMDKSDATRSDYRRTIKQFYFWLEDFDERLLNDNFKVRESAKRIYKFLRREVSTSYKTKKIAPSEVLNDQDIKQILEKGCKTIQEKAIIMTLHETGMRSSDLLLTKISGFTTDKRGIGTIYTGEGKTGSRSVDIIRSVPFIQEHLILHPHRDDSNSLLFYYEDPRNGRIKVMDHERFYRTIRRIIEDSGIKKKRNPHWFRHSRASLDAIDGTMSESVRKVRMGWSNDTKMIANYTHLGQKEVRNAWLRSNGLETDEEKKEEYITCICQRTISTSHQYCPHCGRPTSLKVIEQEKQKSQNLQEEINEVLPLVPSKPTQRKEFFDFIKFTMKMMNDPELLNKFEKFRKER